MMFRSISVLVTSLMAVVPSPMLAQSRATVDANIQRYSGEPQIPAQAEKMAEQGFADHSHADAKASDHSITFVEEGPDGKGVSLTMDPISGEIAPVKSR